MDYMLQVGRSLWTQTHFLWGVGMLCVCVDIVVHPERLLRGRCEPQVCRKRSVRRTNTLLNTVTEEGRGPYILSACGCGLDFGIQLLASPGRTLEAKVNGLPVSAR